MVVPAGTYAGQSLPLESVGLWAYVLSRADLPEDVAYRLIRAIHRGESKLKTRLPQGGYTTAGNTASEIPGPERLHPGTARYLREIQLLK